MKYPFISQILADIAPEMNIMVELEPEFGFVGELVFHNGTRHLFRNANFNINPAGSTEIAKDKGYTNYILNKHGFNVPEGKTFFSNSMIRNLPNDKRRGIASAIDYVQTIGYPVFIKPNNLHQGILVTKIYQNSDLECVAERIFEKTDVLLVERAYSGRDYRIVVLNDKIISAYERIPLFVVGDGKHMIQDLLISAKNNLEKIGRPNAEIDLEDYRIDMNLVRQNLSRKSVVPEGEKIFLLNNANLSSGGTSQDVTHSIHESFIEKALKATKTLGLRLSGVDVICEDITSDIEKQEWCILEVNAAPGLDNYASLGDEQLERVKMLYMEILRYLEKMLL